MRDPAAAVYAFCREADDAVDLGGSAEAVARMRERLDRVYAGRPLSAPADRALARVVERYGLPHALPEALLEGFEWDAEGRQYEDLPGLLAYAARVAGSVGAMMVVLMGVRAPEVVARACDLGVAMQLSNIARDVGEDARAGRLYLPIRWLQEVGVEAQDWLARPVFTAGIGEVVQRLLRVADGLYARADLGIARLPLAFRPGIKAARLLYAEIGREVERAGLDSVSRRVVVTSRRKADLLVRSLIEAAVPMRDVPTPLLDEVGFLVGAVVAAPLRAAAITRPRSLDSRVAWLIELFEQLDQRQRAKG